MKRLIILLGLLSLIGCEWADPNSDTNNRLSRPDVANSERAINSILYVYDARVDLCFAILRSRSSDFYQIYSITIVPFEKVKDKVKVIYIPQKEMQY